nr:MAG TPA: hypothetical protein [Caudoviricetes sp.]
MKLYKGIFAEAEAQSEKISEELERDSRRYSHGFSEEDEVRQR